MSKLLMKKSKGFGVVEKIEVAGFEFRKFGSLRQFEIEWFDAQSTKRIEGLIPVYELAERVSKELELPEEVALGLIQGVGDADLYQKVLLKFYKELMDVKKKSYSETDFQRDIVTMMILSRVSKDFLSENVSSINEYFDISIDATNPTWDDGYTGNLPLSSISAIIDFTTGERTEWVNEPSVEEELDLGKSEEG